MNIKGQKKNPGKNYPVNVFKVKTKLINGILIHKKNQSLKVRVQMWKMLNKSSYYLQFVSIRMTTIRLLKGTPSTTHFIFLQWPYFIFIFSWLKGETTTDSGGLENKQRSTLHLLMHISSLIIYCLFCE